jgi:hypothetical protein
LVSDTGRNVLTMTGQRRCVGDVPELVQASADTVPGSSHMPVSVQ